MFCLVNEVWIIHSITIQFFPLPVVGVIGSWEWGAGGISLPHLVSSQSESLSYTRGLSWAMESGVVTGKAPLMFSLPVPPHLERVHSSRKVQLNGAFSLELSQALRQNSLSFQNSLLMPLDLTFFSSCYRFFCRRGSPLGPGNRDFVPFYLQLQDQHSSWHIIDSLWMPDEWGGNDEAPQILKALIIHGWRVKRRVKFNVKLIFAPQSWLSSDSFFLSWATWILMVIFLQGCWVYKMTELCLPWTWGCPLLRSFQQSLGVKLWHCGQKASGESLRGKTSWIRKALSSGPWVLQNYAVT